MTDKYSRPAFQVRQPRLSTRKRHPAASPVRSRRTVLALSLSASTALACLLNLVPQAHAVANTPSDSRRADTELSLTKQAITYSNPESVHAPAGSYSHSAVVPAGARTLFISGQIGVRPDGSFGKTLAEQADQAFRNIKAILRAHGMGPSDIVKLTTYVVAGQTGGDVRDARAAHLGDHRPTATFIFVPQLYAPEWLVEIEVTAAKL